MRDLVPLKEIAGHMVHVPVQVGDRIQSRFIIDTGIGLNLMSSKLAERAGVHLTGEVHMGKRMSGQEVSVPLGEVPVLAVGTCRRERLLVGVFDLDLPAQMTVIEGFLSPVFFEGIPFTICRQARHVALEGEESMGARLRDGIEVPVKVNRVGPSVSLFVDLRLPSGTEVSAEVDTGSDALILDTRLMASLGMAPGGVGVERRDGTDETGHTYVRYLTRVQGSVSLCDAPGIAQSDLDVMFQNIIYDGLLGDQFLKAYDVTYDVAKSRVVFATPGI